MKRRLLSFFLMVIMLFSIAFLGNFSSSFADGDASLQISAVEIKNFENGKDAEIMLEVSNSSSEDISAYLINGLYEEDTNRLVSYYYVKGSVAANNKMEWGSFIPIPESGKYKIKAFAWDKLSGASVISNILDVGAKEKVGTACLFIDDITERPNPDVTSPSPTGIILPITKGDIYEGDTAASFAKRLLDANGIATEGLDVIPAYLSDVNGLSEFDGGNESGWMYMVNGYPPQISEGFGAGMSDYKVEDNDFVHISYTCQGWGADLGMRFGVSKVNLISDVIVEINGKNKTVDGGFDSSKKNHTLTVDEEVSTIKIRLEQDKEKQRGLTQLKVGEIEYKFWQDIPVEDGTVVKLIDSAKTHNLSIIYGDLPVTTSGSASVIID